MDVSMISKEQLYFAELCECHAKSLFEAGDIRGSIGASECAQLIRELSYDKYGNFPASKLHLAFIMGPGGKKQCSREGS